MLTKLKLPARHLMGGDLVGSGETVIAVQRGCRIPRGKIEVLLEKNGRRRIALWGAGTMINIQRETPTINATAVTLCDHFDPLWPNCLIGRPERR